MALFSEAAHAVGLAIAQKNSAELVARRLELGTDFAVAEECNRFAECGVYVEGYVDLVFVIEYRRADFDDGCAAWPDLSIVLRDLDLTTPRGRRRLRRLLSFGRLRSSAQPRREARAPPGQQRQERLGALPAMQGFGVSGVLQRLAAACPESAPKSLSIISPKTAGCRRRPARPPSAPGGLLDVAISLLACCSDITSRDRLSELRGRVSMLYRRGRPVGRRAG